MLALLVGTLIAAFALKRIITLIQIRKDLGYLPQYVCLFAPLANLGASLPTTWWNPGLGFIYRDRKTLYANTRNKTFVATPILNGPPLIYTTSFHAFKQMLAITAPWQKPELANQDLSLLGPNVVASNGELWKRHRRITAPAFNQSAYENVWKVTAGVYSEISEKESWNGRNVADVADMNLLTHKVAMFIIAICGFGLPMAWASPERDERGRMSIERMVLEVATTIIARARLPSWTYKLGIAKLNTIDEAYTQFVELMQESISEREEQIKKLRAVSGGDADISDLVKDLLGRLVSARIGEGKLPLTDEEVIANIFVMMFAGHETTANTLAAALGLLAYHQDIQESVYKSIRKVLGDREPSFDDYDDLEDILAVFYEALRLYPAAFVNLRCAKEDTVLTVPRKDNPEILDRFPIKKDTQVVLDFIGYNYDPDNYPDPESFRPGRWLKSTSAAQSDEKKRFEATNEAPEPMSALETSSLDGFIGFSFGARTCLGHKFAKVEAVCFLTNLLREWRVEVILEKGETMEMWKERVLTPKFIFTLSFGEVPMRLVRREKA